MGIYIDFRSGEAFEGVFENGKKNGNINKYKIQIDSTCIYSNNNCIEENKKEKNFNENDETEFPKFLTRKNLQRTSQEFKTFCESIKNNVNKNENVMQKVLSINNINLIENNNNNDNDTRSADKLKELLNFKDLNKLGTGGMSSISSDIYNENSETNSVKGSNINNNMNFMQKFIGLNNNNNNTISNIDNNNYSNSVANSEGNLSSDLNGANLNANANGDPNKNCLIF
jgi:hypothetical protein